jgi:hypothetical protein
MHRTHRSTVQFDCSCFSCWVQHAMQAFAPSVFQFGQYCVIIFSHPVGVCDTATRAQASTVAPTSASFAIVEFHVRTSYVTPGLAFEIQATEQNRTLVQ